jgi:hypothetical protein
MTHGLEFDRAVPTIADGMLQRLWRWAFDHAPDGDITDLGMDDLRELTGWADEGADLLAMLLSCGFVYTSDDGRTLIAKWKDWGGAYFAPEAAEARQKWRDEFSKRQSDRAQRRWHPELFDDECNATSCGSDAGGMPEELEEELEVKNLMSDSSESDCFDSFWKSYPRREAKAGAHSLWLKMSNTDRLAALAAVKHYATWCKANRDSLVMMPTTFLSKTGRRWEEWLNGPPAGRNNGAARPAPVEKPLCKCGTTLTTDEHGVVHCPMCGWEEI